MNATPSCNYTLRTIQPPTSDQTAYSELMMAGAPTGKVLDGVILEAALTWGPYLLLFVTDDVPYEEILHIYLLDKDLNTQDTAWLGAMYCTGVFSDLDAAGANTVRFRFFGGLAHTLTLLPKPSFALPFFSDPAFIRRPFKWTCRFRLDVQPLPETEAPPPQ